MNWRENEFNKIGSFLIDFRVVRIFYARRMSNCENENNNKKIDYDFCGGSERLCRLRLKLKGFLNQTISIVLLYIE